MISATEKRKILNAIIASSFFGLLIIILFPIVDQQPWHIGFIPGSFAFGFIPVFLIMIYNIFISSKYLVKLNGIFYLLINSIVYFIIIFFTIMFIIILFGLSPDYIAGTRSFFEVMLHPDSVFGMKAIAVTILIIQFYILINSFLGKGILFKLFFGTYRKPKEIEKVFMFLDIKSSTTIAEEIGHLAFISLLRDFFFDLSESIAETSGEIYKYVGDEAIITWDTKKNTKKNCISFFFNLKTKIKSKENYYMKKYGLLPDFKAGVHCGTVVIGEIGNQKKEITYLGDVINTTARIEGACITLEEDLLVSEDVKTLLINPRFIFEELGSTELRGKSKKIQLFSVRSNDSF